jgi:hypothetical protein
MYWSKHQMNAQASDFSDIDEPPGELTPDERCELFDRNARYHLGVTGDEFRRRWNADGYANETDTFVREAVEAVANLLPLVEDEPFDPRAHAKLVETARDVPDIHYPTRDEAWEMFDQRARKRLFISGAEFYTRWRAGEFEGNDYWPNHLAIIDVYMSMPKDDPDADWLEASMSATSQDDEDWMAEDEMVPEVIHMSHLEAREMFDESARYWLDMSGDEFLRKWRNREFGDVDNHPNHLRIMEVASLLPFVTNGPHEW